MRIAIVVVKLKVFKVLRIDSVFMNSSFWQDFYKKETDPKFVVLVQLWQPIFFPEDSQNRKRYEVVGKNFSYYAIQICQNQGSISSPLSKKNTITIWNIWAIFARKQGRVTNKGLEPKFDKIFWVC